MTRRRNARSALDAAAMRARCRRAKLVGDTQAEGGTDGARTRPHRPFAGSIYRPRGDGQFSAASGGWPTPVSLRARSSLRTIVVESNVKKVSTPPRDIGEFLVRKRCGRGQQVLGASRDAHARDPRIVQSQLDHSWRRGAVNAERDGMNHLRRFSSSAATK